jgi:hypothetical protein
MYPSTLSDSKASMIVDVDDNIRSIIRESAAAQSFDVWPVSSSQNSAASHVRRILQAGRTRIPHLGEKLRQSS